MGRYFDLMPGHNSSNFTDSFLVFDFDRLRHRRLQVFGDDAMFRAPESSRATCAAREVQERVRAVQQDVRTEDAVPCRRWRAYEETEVFSESLVRIGQQIGWDSANEFNIRFATRARVRSRARASTTTCCRLST
jgi:hypothetical protein